MDISPLIIVSLDWFQVASIKKFALNPVLYLNEISLSCNT